MRHGRRFPPLLVSRGAISLLWSCVTATRQALAYVYFEEEPGRRAAAALRRGEALRERLEARFSGLCLPISKSVS
jgi:hypothetical protein